MADPGLQNSNADSKDGELVVTSLDAAELQARKPFVPRAGKAADPTSFAANFLGAYDTKAPEDTFRLLDALDLDYGFADRPGNRRVRARTLTMMCPFLTSLTLQGNIDLCAKHALAGKTIVLC